MQPFDLLAFRMELFARSPIGLFLVRVGLLLALPFRSALLNKPLQILQIKSGRPLSGRRTALACVPIPHLFALFAFASATAIGPDDRI
jgi:hypothetical protein